MAGQDSTQVFPVLPRHIEDALRASIERFGVLVPVVTDQHGRVLDGHHRARIAAELGVPYRVDVVQVASEEEARAIAYTLNADRRQLDAEQRRAVAVALRQLGHSERAIAGALGVNQSTVHRDLLRSTDADASVDFPERVLGLDGKRRPARRPLVVATKAPREARAVMRALARLDEADVSLDGSEGVVDPATVRRVARDAERQRRAQDTRPSASEPLPGNVVLAVADARQLPLADESVDLIVTSPPYGIEKPYERGDVAASEWPLFMASWLREALRVTRPGGRLALNIPLDTAEGGFRPTYAEAVAAALSVGWTYRSTIVWAEGNISRSTARGSVDSAAAPHVIAPVEMVALFSRGPWKREAAPDSDLAHDEWLEWTNGLWSFAGESRPWEGHPAPFPIELPRRLIKLLSFPGDTVLDPFVGSGTTVLAAHALGRRAIGFDISPTYIASATRRISEWKRAGSASNAS